MCCCTNDGEGHRCPDAWHLILKAQLLRLAHDVPALAATRRAYTAHLVAARLLPPGATAWPDLCTITIAEDPQCPRCRREESTR